LVGELAEVEAICSVVVAVVLPALHNSIKSCDARKFVQLTFSTVSNNDTPLQLLSGSYNWIDWQVSLQRLDLLCGDCAGSTFSARLLYPAMMRLNSFCHHEFAIAAHF
jgi:hypothetical protein